MKHGTKTTDEGQSPVKLELADQVAGREANHLDAVIVRHADKGMTAELRVAGATLSVPASAIDTYGACRRELLKRYGVRLVLWECEGHRFARENREAWLEEVAAAIARGEEAAR